MSLKTTVVLLLILGLLAGLYWVSDPSPPGITPGTGEQPLLAGISWNDVRVLKVLSLNRSTEYLFQLRPDGTWWMEEPVRDLASAAWIRQLREIYEGSQRTLAFKRDAINEKVLKDTGLQAPRAFVEFRTTGRELRVDVGEEDVQRDAIFVRVDGDIYRSRAALWSATQINVDEARERTCFRNSLPDLTALTIVRRAAEAGGQTETLQFEGQYHSGFRLTAPIQARCDNRVIQNFMAALLGMRVHTFHGGEVRDRKALGLDPPAHELTLQGSRGREVVHVAALKPEASAAYAWIADRDLFVTVEFRELARTLEAPLEAFRSRLLFPFPGVKARRIRVDAGRGSGDVLVLKQTSAENQSGHDLEAPVQSPADPIAVGTLIEALDSLVAIEFLPPGFTLAEAGLEQPALTIELTGDRGARHTVRLGAVRPGSPPLVYARREDESWVVAVPAEKLPALRVHWTQVLDKRVMKLRAHEVQRVELMAGDQPLRTWRKQAGAWLKAEGAATTGGSEDAAFRNLLEDRLLDLRAEGVVPDRAEVALAGMKPVASVRFLSNEMATPLAVLDLFRKDDLLWARRDGTVVVFVLKTLDARNLGDVLGLPR